MPHALVNISHRQFALEVSGVHAATLLSGACPLDLDLGEFPVGMCTRTVLAKADIVLWRTRDDAFQLEVWRSFSGYAAGLLREIAREFYAERARGPAPSWYAARPAGPARAFSQRHLRLGPRGRD